MLDYTEVALTWRALGHGPPRPDDVVAIVRQFHRESLLTVLIRLNLALTHQRGPSQDDIIRKWLVPDKAEAMLRLVQQEGMQVIFHEGQVLNAIRLALLHCPEDEGLRLGTMGELELLTRALLMLSDLMFPDGSEERRRAAIFSTMTRGEVFRHNETYLPNIISRCYDLFVGLPPVVQTTGPFRDLRGLFGKATGMEFEDYLALTFGVLAFYDNLDPQNIGNAPIGVQRAAWLGDTRIAAEVRDRLWTQLSLPIDRYREEVLAEWQRSGEAGRWAAMRVFSEHPVIEFPDGSLVCVSRLLLRDRFTDGLYWIIANSLQGTSARNTFTNFFGEVFEEHIRRCMLRSLGRGFHARATYGPRARPLVDGALVKPRSLALMESKAARLLLRAREVGAEADLQASVERVLDEAAAQLADAIRAGQEGQLARLGVHGDTRYYPIIVTYEPLPAHPFALELYDRILYRDSRLGGANVRPVTMMNTRDVESLEAIIGDGEEWPDVLFRKHTPMYRYLPFHNYVYERYAGEMPKNPYLAARWRRVGEIIGTRLFGEPLKVAEPPRPRWGQGRRGRGG
jgi:hypothetical protein